MDQILNEQLSSVFASGTGLKSNSLITTTESITALNDVNTRLVTLADDMTPSVTEPANTALTLTPLETELQALGERIQTTYLPILDNYHIQLDLLTNHIEEHLENFFDELSVASAMTSISDYSDVNTTMNGISGSVLGAIDAQLANAETAMNELEQEIDSFSLDLIEELTPLTELELILIQATDTLTSASNTVQTTISSETTALSQMYSRYQRHAKAVSTQLLVSDTNTAAIVAQLASPELSALLT